MSLNNTIKITSAGKQLKYTGEISFSKDKDDVMGTGDVKLVLSNQNWYDWAPIATELKIEGGVFDNGVLFNGRTAEVEQDDIYMSTPIQDLGWKLKRPYDGDYSGDISDVFKKLITAAGLIPVLKGIKKEKITRNGIYSSDNVQGYLSGKGVCGTGKSSCSYCSRKAGGKTYTTCIENRCPHCGKTGTMKYFRAKNKTDFQGPCGRLEYSGGQAGDARRGKYAIVEGMFMCCACDSDYCIVCGHNHRQTEVASILSGGLNSKKAESTSTSTSSTSSSDKDTETDSNLPDQPVSYEDELKKICDPRDYHVSVNQKGECVIQSSNMPGAASFEVKRWMMEAGSYNEGINEINIPTVAKVVYNKGTAKAYYKPLYNVYGEINPITESQPKMHKDEAERRAQALLNQVLRDKKLKVSFKMLATHRVYPGAWIKVTNPKTGISNILFVQSVDLDLDPKQVFTMSVECRYGPATPTFNDNSFTEVMGNVTSIANEAKKYRWCDGAQDAAGMVRNGCGSCWAMSEFLYNKCRAAGIPARIVQYKTVYSSRHRTVQIKQGSSWVDFPYSGLDKMFKATSAAKYGKVIAG